ncbi:MAG: STAS domain-containing protein [Caldilineaceae bacterium]
MKSNCPQGAAQRPVVILRMRGRTEIGSTVIGVLERYAGQVQVAGGKLMLAGVSDRVLEQIRRTETTDTIAEADIFVATPNVG